MTTLDEDPLDDVLEDEEPDADRERSEEGPVDVPDAAIVADAVELDDVEEADLLTDGPYGTTEAATETDEPDEDEGDDAPDLVVPAAPERLTRRQHRAEMKASALRVRRVVRHVDPWSVFKVASLFIACVWGVIVLASLLIWRVAVESGSVDDVESFVVDLGFRDFAFDPQQMFESLLSVGAVMAVAAVFFTVLLTVLFNLICDLTGGVRITMIEQDLAEARKRARRRD